MNKKYHNIVEIEDITLLHTTEKAILVLNLKDEKTWIPFAWIDNFEVKTNLDQSQTCAFSISQPSAEEKELV